MNAPLRNQLSEIDDLTRADNCDEALRRLDLLAESHPGEAWIWRSRSYANSRRGEIQSALKDLAKAIEKCDQEPDFFYTRGILLFQEGRFREAVPDFTRVIELCALLGSNYYREGAYLFRADAHLRLRAYDKARADCRHVSDAMRTWTDRLRTKSEILAECAEAEQ